MNLNILDSLTSTKLYYYKLQAVTLPWHNWAGGGNLTIITIHKHPSGLTSTRANRPAMSSSIRYQQALQKTKTS
jgi:hypothetical protein